MAVFQRILKVLAALAASNAIALVTQLLLPPVFIHRYGTPSYGEWLALSAAVAYLSTLNFGIQTFVNQDLTVRYHRNDLADYHLRQSTALRLLCGIVVVAAVLATGIFALPLKSLMKIALSQRTASIALYFLSLQILAGIPFNYLIGTFMVVGKSHRGFSWNNALRLANTLTTALLAWFRVDFALLAVAQFVLYPLWIVLVLIDLRRTAPEIYPSLRYWDGSAIKEILKPSGHFALIFSCSFLAFQLPVLLLQRMLGPVTVVAFTVMRTIFSMARQALAALTQSMGPEITRLYGLGDWPNLSRLYNYSERMIFALIPVVNLGVLLASPLLLTAWLHKPGLFSPWPYLTCAAISTVMSAKEHKYQFQFSTNTHEQLARVMFSSYLAMGALAVPAVARFGLNGFLLDWLATELFQFAFIVRLNMRLFAHTGSHELRYLFRLAALALAGFAAAAFLLQHGAAVTLLQQAGRAAAMMLTLLLLAFPLFRLGDVARKLRSRAASA
jgi:O-antigen/teichoic acid export membrane protein